MKKATHITPDLFEDTDTNAAQIVRSLAELNFEAAAGPVTLWKAAKDAAVLARREPAAAAAVHAFDYWQHLLPGRARPGSNPVETEQLHTLIRHYQQYDFGRWLSGFSDRLLLLLTQMTKDLLSHAHSVSDSCTPSVYKIIETLTIRLMERHTPTTKLAATELLSFAARQFKQDGNIALLLAACNYHTRKKPEAYQQYAYCLLHYPVQATSYKIALLPMPPEISRLLALMEPARAVITGILQQFLPLISVPDNLHFASSSQDAALNCYRTFYRAEQAMKNNEAPEKIIAYRKALLTADPVLGKKYLELIKSRMG